MYYWQKRTAAQREYYANWKPRPKGYESQYSRLAGFWRKLHPWQFLNEGDTAIQVGFNTYLVEKGLSQALIMSAIAEHTVAIDPDPTNINNMRKYCREHQVGMEIIERAVWDKDEELKFQFFDETQRNTAKPIIELFGGKWEKRAPSQGREVTVWGQTLDEIVGDMKVDFINLTVNGAEKQALDGMQGVLEQSPTISIALKSKDNWSFDIRLPVLDELISRGYKIALANADPVPTSKEPFLFACAVKRDHEDLERMGFRTMTQADMDRLMKSNGEWKVG